MSNQKITIQYDDDGFLIGKKRIDHVQAKLDATYDATKQILKAVKHPTARRMVVSGRVSIQNNAKTSQTQSNRPKVISNSKKKSALKATINQSLSQQTPAQKQIQQQANRRERRYRNAVSKSNQIQEKLLKDINKNIKNQGQSSGLLKTILPFLAAGAIAKGLFKLPLALGAGAAGLLGLKKGAAAIAGGGRDAKGRFVSPAVGLPQGAKQGFLSKAIKGIGKGGLLAAAMAAFSGIGVEKSDMDRPDKNKAHFKNFFAASGGVAGAAGGAAMGAAVGSVIPVVGTAIGAVIGGVLGGVGGSTLAEYFIERVDDAIDPDLSRTMFGSWQGFMSVLNYGAYNVWQALIPEKVHTFFTKLGVDSSTYYTTITGLASLFWTTTTDSAKMLWETYVPNEVKVFFSNLAVLGKAAFDEFKDGFNKLFEAIAKTPVGEALGDSWTWVKNKAGQAWDSAKEYVGISDSQSVKGNARQQANDAARRGNWQGGSSQNLSNKAMDSLMSATVADMNSRFSHLGYNMGSKSLKGSEIDCSGWVNHVQQQTIDAINKSMGDGTISSEKKNAMRLAAANGGAAGILKYAMGQGGSMQDDEITAAKLQDGMVLGMAKSKSHASGRFKNIGHVVTVFTDPKTGQKMVSESATGESAGGKNHRRGVRVRTLDEYLATEASRRKNDKNRHLYAGDPYAQERAKMGGVQSKPMQLASHTPPKSTSFDQIPIVNVLEVGSGYNIVELADGSIIKQTGPWNWRNRNQGNLEDGSFAKGANGLDQGSAKGANSSKRFAAFSTFQEGRLAKQKLIFSGKNYKNLSLTDAIARFAPPTENDTELYQKTILSAVGGANKRMGDYTAAEQAKIMDAIERHEGMKVGKVEVLRQGRKAMAVQHAAVQTPKITQSPSQQMAVNANTVAVNAAKIEPQKISTPPMQNNPSSNGQLPNGATSTSGQIAHAPVRRQVSNPEIASITSGGIGA